jgi:hypothetical protein
MVLKYLEDPALEVAGLWHADELGVVGPGAQTG